MVFSVASVIVAIGVLSYAVAKAAKTGALRVPESAAPALEVRWHFVTRGTTHGYVRNISEAPVSIAKMSIPAVAQKFNHGFHYGSQDVAVIANWNEEIDRQDPEAVVKVLAGQMVDTVIQPGAYKSFSIPIAMRQLPSGLIITLDDATHARYTEQLPAPD